MELIGTELPPDWAIYRGDHQLRLSASPEETGASPFGPDFDARFASSAASRDERFHYRYLAADLMWHCAELLPDNDVLTAHALYLGGIYLKSRDPREADRFYKALVRRNPNLLIAQRADKLRWFPGEFTDTVVYHSPPRRLSRRQAAKNLALALVIVPIVVGGAWLLRRRTANLTGLKS